MAEELNNKQKDEIVQQVKKKQVRPNSSKNRQVQMEEGDNTKYNLHALQIMTLPKINSNSAEEVHRRSVEYFSICSNNDMKPSVAGYSLALGVDRTTLWRWVTAQPGYIKPQAVRDELKLFYNVLNMQMEDYMQNGKINPVSGIFLMKNSFGYTDKQEVVVSPNKIEESNPESLIEESSLLNSDDIID